MSARITAVALLSMGVSLVALAPGAQAARCTVLDGPFESTIETGPGCNTSPIFTCSHGRLQGTLDANYEFTFESLTADPNDPARLNYAGTSLITFPDGARVFGRDTGFFRLRPDGGGTFETTVRIQGGTSDYMNASGHIVASGAFQQGGSAIGSYDGFICQPSGVGGCGQ